ncbi:hypothetical protein BT96DRAFT_989316 [Gymnopus androsaceus JB14]|uniref:Uncharacterized protein n=1 Tax=Gymnopus androsaceus JB14 TaxID=1447944 RepID=A0A6A4I3H3_9AGAR|nr:hypothetical protein BT96DRAFT_989316 [Gymnopus androsaceus JB14]
MHFNSFALLSLFATISITVASPTTTCSDAYNGNTGDNRGPGVVYSCNSVTSFYSRMFAKGPARVPFPGEPAAVGGCFPL